MTQDAQIRYLNQCNGNTWEAQPGAVRRYTVVSATSLCNEFSKTVTAPSDAPTCRSCCINKLPNCREQVTFPTLYCNLKASCLSHEHFTTVKCQKMSILKSFPHIICVEKSPDVFFYQSVCFSIQNTDPRISASRSDDVSDRNERNENNASHLPLSCFCPVGRMEIISHKKVSDSSQLEPRVENLHLLCIRWAGLSSVANQSWLSVRAEDMSPVSSHPIWFPPTNVTAVPPGYRVDNSTVCVCVCVCAILSAKWFCTASVSTVPALACVSTRICVCMHQRVCLTCIYISFCKYL